MTFDRYGFDSAVYKAELNKLLAELFFWQSKSSRLEHVQLAKIVTKAFRFFFIRQKQCWITSIKNTHNKKKMFPSFVIV